MLRVNMCKGCWAQMHMPIFIGGPLSIPFRILGVRRSRMNPNLCTLCETMFRRIKRSKQITLPLTVLCADLRGYTAMAETADHAAVAYLLEVFYGHCGEAIWERDGLINKFIGDSVLALFNFPITHGDHARLAVEAALDLQPPLQAGEPKQPAGGSDQTGRGRRDLLRHYRGWRHRGILP